MQHSGTSDAKVVHLPEAPTRTIRLYSPAELANQPQLEWLVEDHMYAGSLGVLYGPPGSYKSFLALDLSLSVATGQTWHGTRVSQGNAVYVAAEAGSGIHRRIDAWCTLHRYPEWQLGGKYWVVKHPLNLLDYGQDGDVNAFIRGLERLDDAPSLVVIDTLARSMAGGDENSPKDMGKAVESAARIQRTTGAAVLVVHHPARAGKNPRGHGALEGAVDMRMRATKGGGDSRTVKVVCEKQKEAELFQPRAFAFHPVGESGALVEATTAPKTVDVSRDTSLTERIASALHDADEPLSKSKVAERVGGNKRRILAEIDRAADLRGSHVVVADYVRRNPRYACGCASCRPEQPDDAATEGTRARL